jgi:Uma2 family endonuclease
MILETEQTARLPRMTEEEFVAWCDEDTRAEFVDGRVIVMCPVSLLHLEPNQFLAKLLGLFEEERPGGRVLGPEFMVRLRAGLRRVPDLLYVAPEHLERIQQTVLEGAPDGVWEIISADSEERDWREKLPEYEQAGVREYWIVNPYVKTVYLYRLNAEGRYESIEPLEGRLHSEVIPGFWLRPEWLVQPPRPKVMDCLREMGVIS